MRLEEEKAVGLAMSRQDLPFTDDGGRVSLHGES